MVEKMAIAMYIAAAQKKIHISNPRHYVVTYPSSTPWIKLRTEHLRLRAIIEEDRS